MANNTVETIIDGTLDRNKIRTAIRAYIDGLERMAYPPDLHTAIGLADLGDLKSLFDKGTHVIADTTEEIIREINARAQDLRDPAYLALQEKDKALWNANGHGRVQFGVLTCVDKGVPGEAIGIDVSNVGRTLGGDIEFAYIPTKNSFVPVGSALIKRLIHYGRQGRNTIVEPLIEHTSCGRRGQILANEQARRDIPSLSYIFDHADALFPGDNGTDVISGIRTLWKTTWKRNGRAVITPDKGLYAGVVQKIAQRQSLRQLGDYMRILIPIEVFEKETGNVYAGLDSPEALSHPITVRAGGYTADALSALAADGVIFSLRTFADRLFPDIAERVSVPAGARTYPDLQRIWLSCIDELVRITEACWNLFDEEHTEIRKCVSRFFVAGLGHEPDSSDASERRLIHHLFHMTAYAYLFGTLDRGHEPGMRHIEEYLATGDHEIGAKPTLALGQGDLDRPNASEIFTGYSVLLHSKPGHNGSPIPVFIKLDTDRTGDRPMSTEETNVAFDDLHEFLKLWPYFLVGDMIPILMVRGKRSGGVSRLGLSIVKALGDMTALYEQTGTYLPRFVQANNTQGEVVMVPARDILVTGLNSDGNLKSFRNAMTKLADQFSDPAVQARFVS